MLTSWPQPLHLRDGETGGRARLGAVGAPQGAERGAGIGAAQDERGVEAES